MDQRLAVGLGAAAVLGIGLGVGAFVSGWIGGEPMPVSLGDASATGGTSSGAAGEAPSGAVAASSDAVPGVPTGEVTLSAEATGGFLTRASTPIPSLTTVTARPRTSPTGRPSPSVPSSGSPSPTGVPYPSRTTIPGSPSWTPPSGSAIYPTTRAGTPTPSMALVVYRTSADGTATVVLGARVSAFLPVMDGGDTLVSRTMRFGDGTTAWTASTQRCVTGAAARTEEGSWSYEHTYTRPGTYTVTFEAVACAPVGTRTTTLEVTVV